MPNEPLALWPHYARWQTIQQGRVLEFLLRLNFAQALTACHRFLYSFLSWCVLVRLRACLGLPLGRSLLPFHPGTNNVGRRALLRLPSGKMIRK